MRNLQNSHYFYRKNVKNRIRQIRSLDAVLSKGSHSKIPLFCKENKSKSTQSPTRSNRSGCWTGAACWLASAKRGFCTWLESVCFGNLAILSYKKYTDFLLLSDYSGSAIETLSLSRKYTESEQNSIPRFPHAPEKI